MTNSSPTQILAIIPNWLGDVAMCTPALRALRTGYPDAHLTVIGPPGACELLEGLDWISELLPLRRRAGLVTLARMAISLRGRGDSMAVVFPHSFRSALFARLSGARRRVGLIANSRSWLLTEATAPSREKGRIRPVYMTDEYMGVVAAVGCEDDGLGLELSADPMAVATVKEHLVGPGPYVGIAPGAAFGPSKQWPVERYMAVIDAIGGQTGAQCVLLTGPGEEGIRDAIVKGTSSTPVICDEGNPSIASLKATVSLLDLLICNDSGPRHVAVAFRVPTVCIMGSTSPAYSEGPYEKGQVLRIDVDCGPCQKPICATDHRCMTGISPERVVDAAMAYLPKMKV